MSAAPTETHVEVAGGRCRVLEKGAGPVVGVIAGHFGMPRWTPFLEELSRSRTVRLISPPGFPGSDAHHEGLDGHLDWLTATLDLLDASGVAGNDLIAASVGGMLAMDAVALDPSVVRRLSVTAPYGIYHAAEPVLDLYAHTDADQRALLCQDDGAYEAAFGNPEDPDASAAHQLVMYRAATAAARIVWPFGDRGLEKRLHRVRGPVQLLWGSEDRLAPVSYLDVFAAKIPGDCRKAVIDGAGHLAWIDKPADCAAAIEAFLSA